jgi:hypothetical protein
MDIGCSATLDNVFYICEFQGKRCLARYRWGPVASCQAHGLLASSTAALTASTAGLAVTACPSTLAPAPPQSTLPCPGVSMLVKNTSSRMVGAVAICWSCQSCALKLEIDPSVNGTHSPPCLQVSSTTGRIYTYLTTAQTYDAASTACKALTFPGVTGKGYLVSYGRWGGACRCEQGDEVPASAPDAQPQPPCAPCRSYREQRGVEVYFKYRNGNDMGTYWMGLRQGGATWWVL